MTHAKPPVKVLYITGLGRSGSTILDVVLGNHPHIESVGEVTRLIRTGWVSRKSLRGIDPKRLRRPLCTCGKRLDVPEVEDAEEVCPFWSRVRHRELPGAPGRLRAQEAVAAPAARGAARAVGQVPLLRQAYARVL
jgi:hypothetical protein